MKQTADSGFARALGALTVPWPQPDETAPTGKLSQALRLQWGELTAHADCVIQAVDIGGVGIGRQADPQGLAPLADWVQCHRELWPERIEKLKRVLKELEP